MIALAKTSVQTSALQLIGRVVGGDYGVIPAHGPYMGSGTIQRAKPRIQVLRGFNPQEPLTSRQVALPVKSGEVILSGMVISKLWNAGTVAYEWVKGAAAGQPVYFALQDYTDEDVLASGLLTGLSCAGQFEIKSAYFKADDTYNDGVYLSYDGVTGNAKVTALKSGEEIIARVSRIRGIASNAGIDSSAVSKDVIVFETLSLPNGVDNT